MSNGFRSPRIARSRRRTGWTGGPGSSVNGSLTSSVVQLIGSGLATLADGLTLIRTRGSFQCHLTSASGAGDGFHCALGLCVINENAFAVGATAVMDPIADVDWDGWFYHQFFDVHAASTTITNTGGNAQVRIDIDSKGMRKMGEGDVVVGILESSEEGTAAAEFWFDTRLLFKLP